MANEWGGHALNTEDLAALLDGEVREIALAEQMSSAIAANPQLRGEYEEQRAVKSALGSLEEYEAPAFMSERVLAGIQASRSDAVSYSIEAAELAGLLDGELASSRSDALNQRVNSDSGMMAAFEEQRMVKRALGQLPEFDEPPYMHTRVLARIEAQRGKQAGNLWARLRLAAGGAMLFVGGFVAALQFMQPALQQGTRLAQHEGAPLVSNVGLIHNTDDMFSRLPEAGGLLTDEERAQLSPEAVAYLETLGQAHSESLLQNINHSQSPRMSDAVLVLDINGN